MIPHSAGITFSISDALSDIFIQHTEMKNLKSKCRGHQRLSFVASEPGHETELAKQLLLIYYCSKSFSFSSTSKIINLASDLFEFTVKKEGSFALKYCLFI